MGGHRLSIHCGMSQYIEARSVAEKSCPERCYRIPDDSLQDDSRHYTIRVQTPRSDEDLIKCILDVLGALMLARIPPGMTPEALNIVLSPKDPNPRVILAKLGSVLQRNEENGGFIQLIHKSFDDFLTNPLRCKERWFIDIEAYRRKFSRQCLLSLTDFLVSWMPDSDIPIPPHIRDYALVGRCGTYRVSVFRISRIYASFLKTSCRSASSCIYSSQRRQYS